MTSDTSQHGSSYDIGSLPPDEARRVDEVCDVFETQLVTRQRPSIEMYLRAFSGEARRVLLYELLQLECGDAPRGEAAARLEAYRARFADDDHVVRRVFRDLFGVEAAGPVVEQTAPRDAFEAPSIPNYQVLDHIGEGAMGAVFKALHTRLDRLAAIKVLRGALLNDVAAVVRFRGEMKVVGQLNHPNVVRAHDAGESRGCQYLVMEYVEGFDLGRVVSRFGPLPAADAFEMIRRAALGLQAAHEHDLVHRDVKPSNMLLGRAQGERVAELKVTDLGLARLRGADVSQADVQLQNVMGTFDYMAPEQAWSPDEADIRADIYGLGCALYELLIATPPFPSPKYATPIDKARAHRDTPPPNFTAARPDITPAMWDVLMKMMAKDPADRYATPEQLARKLEPFCGGHDLDRLLDQVKELDDRNVLRAAAGNYQSTNAAAAVADETTPPSPLPREPGAAGRTIDVPRLDAAAETAPAEPARGTGRRAWLAGGALAAIAVLAAALAIPSFRHDPPDAAPARFDQAAIDLLAAVDPTHDAVGQPWAAKNGAIVSPLADQAMLVLGPPGGDAYRLEFTARRLHGATLAIGLVWRGQPQTIVIRPRVQVIDDQPDAPAAHLSHVETPAELVPPSAGQFTYQCVVRPSGFSVYRGEERLFLHTAASGVAPPGDCGWRSGRPDSLFVGSVQSRYQFDSIRLRALP